MGAASKVAEERRIAEMNQQESRDPVSPVTQATTLVELPENSTQTDR
jgi:hypothetical protein